MTFWIDIIERMNASNDIEAMIPTILSELCTYLGYGFGFVYKKDYTNDFQLCDSVNLYEERDMPATLNLRDALGETHWEALGGAHKLSFRNDDQDASPLAEAIAGLFSARSLDLVPITDTDGALIALVGIADRRGRLRIENENKTFTHSILFSLATYIKTGMYQKRVESAEQSLRSVLDNMGIDIYVNDFQNHDILYVNRSMAAPYGGVEKLMGKKCWGALYDDKDGQCEYCPQKKLIDDEGNPTKIYGWDYQRPFDGSWFRVLSAAFQWVDGRLAHVVSSVDITDNKRNEEMIRRMAEYDQLTGLPNRHKLTTDCEKMIEQEQRELYVLFMDLDGFKQVNDTLGHLAGDELLRQIGEKLQSNPTTRDRVYRYGGDEFVVLHEGTPDSLREVIDFIMNSVAGAYTLEAGPARCGTSIGITHYPSDASETSELIRNADYAMYMSKSNGKGIVSFYNQGAISSPEEYAAQHIPPQAGANKGGPPLCGSV